MTADYSIPFWPAFSLDATFQHYGAAPATLRVPVQNVTNKYVEATGFTPGWFAIPPRSIFAYLAVDLGGRR